MIINPLNCGLDLRTNANDMAIGATIMQEGMVIAYESRSLNVCFVRMHCTCLDYKYIYFVKRGPRKGHG